jgi:hypothetical protein
MRLRKWRKAVPLVWLVLATACGCYAQEFSSSERWSHYVRRTYSPARLGLLSAETVLDHALLHPSCWDYSAGSYARRYLRALDRRVIRNTAELGAGILTGEDLRYRPARSRTFHGRIWNALRASATAKMPDGSLRPAYTRFFAISVANVSTAHWTRRSIGAGWVLRSTGSAVYDQAQTNLLDEFSPDLRRVGGRIWKRFRLTGLSR